MIALIDRRQHFPRDPRASTAEILRSLREAFLRAGDAPLPARAAGPEELLGPAAPNEPEPRGYRRVYDGDIGDESELAGAPS